MRWMPKSRGVIFWLNQLIGFGLNCAMGDNRQLHLTYLHCVDVEDKFGHHFCLPRFSFGYGEDFIINFPQKIILFIKMFRWTLGFPFALTNWKFWNIAFFDVLSHIWFRDWLSRKPRLLHLRGCFLKDGNNADY